MTVLRFFTAFFLLVAALSVQADLLRIEAGVGAFNADPGGTFESDTPKIVIDLKDDLKVDTENDLYAWAYIKHPIPIVPNVRVEYLSLKHNPESETSFDVNEIDGILYYNILDNMFFMTLDLGVDVKYIDTDQPNYSSDTAIIGLLYGRFRVDPLKWLGVEAILKMTNYNENSGYDARLKVDLTMSFVPIVQPAFELGYRVHDIDYEIGSLINKSNYKGVYAGLMVRF